MLLNRRIRSKDNTKAQPEMFHCAGHMWGRVKLTYVSRDPHIRLLSRRAHNQPAIIVRDSEGLRYMYRRGQHERNRDVRARVLHKKRGARPEQQMHSIL